MALYLPCPMAIQECNSGRAVICSTWKIEKRRPAMPSSMRSMQAPAKFCFPAPRRFADFRISARPPWVEDASTWERRTGCCMRLGWASRNRNSVSVRIQAELLHHILEIRTIHQKSQKYFVDNVDYISRGVVEIAIFYGNC